MSKRTGSEPCATCLAGGAELEQHDRAGSPVPAPQESCYRVPTRYVDNRR